MRLAVAGSVFLYASYAAAQPLLTLPINCTVGATCFIQHYVDRDPGPSALDYRCGSATYDGHNGTDFRLQTLVAMRQGVAVRAAANGKVLRVRDGMPDISIAIAADRVRSRECGNGVVIEHADGWQTQYCHLLKGSVLVHAGEAVMPGQPIGKVGMSGATEFPHLHFTVRHRGAVVDPFAPAGDAKACTSTSSLWDEQSQVQLHYVGSAVLNAGFAAGPVTMDEVENGAGRGPLSKDAPALVAFMRAINLQAGDTILLQLIGPDGAVLAQGAPVTLDRNKAQFLSYAGRRRPPGGWPAGNYRATFSVVRNGLAVLTKTIQARL